MTTEHSAQPPHMALIAQQTARLLHAWAGEQPQAQKQFQAVADWLHHHTAALPAHVLDEIVANFQELRRAVWVNFVAGRKQPWEKLTGSDLGPLTLEVDDSPLRGDDWLRCQSPFTPASLLHYLRNATAQPKVSGTREHVAPVLSFVPGKIDRHVGSNESLPLCCVPLWEHYHVREYIAQMRADSKANRNRSLPEKLRSCLQRLLSSGSHGCLPPEFQSRLFDHAAVLTEPYLDRHLFHDAREVVRRLRFDLTGKITLEGACRQLRHLGQFAEQVRPILAGRAAGEHRDWVTHLLENFRRLGRLAGYVLGDGGATRHGTAPSVRPAEVDTVATDPVAVAPALPVEPVPPLAPPTDTEAPGAQQPASQAQAVADRDTGTESEAAPPVAADSPPDTAAQPTEEATARALARGYPVIAQFLEAVAAAQQLGEEARASWPRVADVLQSLKYPALHFNNQLENAAQGPAEARRHTIERAADALAEDLARKIARFDDLLPGRGPDVPTPPGVPSHLLPRLTDIRDRLFRVMAEYGGFEVYAIAPGDELRKHAEKLENKFGFVTTTRGTRNTIYQVLRPGYVRKLANGRVETVVPPRVTVVS
jgi:hypothetical protein